jgi:hypothetical protein
MLNLVVDVNNLSFITRYSKLGSPKSKRQKEKNAELLIFVEMTKLILNEATRHNVDGLVLAMDSKHVWRKNVYPEYKGNSTSNEDFYYEETLYAANMVFDFFKEHTSAYCLKVPKTEADDIIAVWCQETSEDAIVLSSDKDYVQLIKENIRVYSPTQKEFRESEDVAFDLFVKCIRGDKNDNIKSAYPRVRLDKLRKAWEDDLELLNLLETKVGDDKVGNAFEKNMTLIDLSRQPDYIRQSIISEISGYNCNKYNQIQVLKFMKSNELEAFSDIFKHKDKALKKPPVFKL